MASVNNVLLIGNLTRDPAMKYLPDGTALAEFGMAMSEKFKDRNGAVRENVTFVDVTFFGRIAEIAGEYLHKGSQACVEGSLKLDTWEDRNGGGKRYKHSIKGRRLTLLGSRGGSDSNRSEHNSAPVDSPNAPSDESGGYYSEAEESSDEIPF